MGLEIISKYTPVLMPFVIIGYLIWKFGIQPRVEHDKEMQEKRDTKEQLNDKVKVFK